MTAVLSSTAFLLLTAMCGLCTIETALGLPTAALTTALSNGDAVNSSKDTESASVDTPGALTTPPSNEGAVGGEKEPEAAHMVSQAALLNTNQEEEESFMESSQISKLKTSKILRRRSSRLVKERRARFVPEDMGEDDSTGHAANRQPRRRDLISCVSHPNNDTIPAAHIKGHGTKPFAHSTFESSKLIHGYQQRWQCCEYSITPSHGQNPHAFVDGGMIFNQTDKSLIVPTCGYYHVFSQIYYQIDTASLNESYRSVYHLLKFKRNCPSWPEFNPISVMGKSAVARDDTTTYTSDIIRLCAGGKIWVEIPDFNDRVPCCPIGDEQGTFIGAYMVAETSCHWPPRIEMDNFNTD